MGMILGLTTLNDENINKLLSDPPLVWKILAPDDPEIFEEAQNSNISLTRFFSKLFKKNNTFEPDTISFLELSDNEGTDIDLDKAWHGIHYLLTGSIWGGDEPLNFLLAGGENIGEIDVGYGQARCIKSLNVKKINEALLEISIENFKARFEPEKMMIEKIYPEIWDRKEENWNLDYLAEYFEDLKQFIFKAAQNKMGIIISIT